MASGFCEVPQVASDYGQTVLEAFNEGETGLASEKALRAGLANWSASLQDVDEALDFTNDRYVEGTIDMTGLRFL